MQGRLGRLGKLSPRKLSSSALPLTNFMSSELIFLGPLRKVQNHSGENFDLYLLTPDVEFRLDLPIWTVEPHYRHRQTQPRPMSESSARHSSSELTRLRVGEGDGDVVWNKVMFSKTDRPPWFLTRKAPVFSFSVLRQQLLSFSTASQAASDNKTRRGWVETVIPLHYLTVRLNYTDLTCGWSMLVVGVVDMERSWFFLSSSLIISYYKTEKQISNYAEGWRWRYFKLNLMSYGSIECIKYPCN